MVSFYYARKGFFPCIYFYLKKFTSVSKIYFKFSLLYLHFLADLTQLKLYIHVSVHMLVSMITNNKEWFKHKTLYTKSDESLYWNAEKFPNLYFSEVQLFYNLSQYRLYLIITSQGLFFKAKNKSNPTYKRNGNRYLLNEKNVLLRTKHIRNM